MLAVIQTGAENDYILTIGISLPQNVAQVIEIARIAHRHQDVPRPNTHGSAAQLLVAVNTELIQTLRLARTFPRNSPLGIAENGKEDRAERHAGNGRFLFGEE